MKFNTSRSLVRFSNMFGNVFGNVLVMLRSMFWHMLVMFGDVFGNVFGDVLVMFGDIRLVSMILVSMVILVMLVLLADIRWVFLLVPIVNMRAVVRNEVIRDVALRMNINVWHMVINNIGVVVDGIVFGNRQGERCRDQERDIEKHAK